MKRILFFLVLFALTAAPALAVPIVTVDRVGTLYDPYIGGGQYRVVPNADLMAITAETGPFVSFCVEAHEPIDDTGVTNYLASVLIEAILGDGNPGMSGSFGGDPLSPLTAYLYTQLRSGTLGGYNNDMASAGALQAAIWYIEDETNWTNWNMLSGQSQAFVTDAQNAGWDGIGNVRVLHLWTEETPDKPTHCQDLLVMIPEPATVLLLGLGALVLIKKR